MEHRFEHYWEQIDENFNWDRVYQSMKLLDWTWGMGADASIPSVAMLKKKAKRLCKDAFVDRQTYSTGGFSAQVDEGMLSLSFILEEWAVED